MDILAAQGVPIMARRNYLIEVRHVMLWGVFAGMFEGSISSIIVSLTFVADPWLISIVMASPMCANLLGLVWGSVATGRRKLPLFMGLAAGTAATIASIGLTPATPVGGWVFAAQIVVARVLLSGCLTVRSALWKRNYPTASRGRIAARLQMARFAFGIITVVVVMKLFTKWPRSYVYAYPTAALLGLLAILVIRSMHVRGEKTELAQLDRLRRVSSSPPPSGLRVLLRSGIKVLRDDPDYRRYMLGMTLLGSANIMTMPLMTIIITKQLMLSYFDSGNLLEVLPRLLMLASLGPWAGLFDRVGVVRFRIINASAWAGLSVFGGLGATVICYMPDFLDALPVFVTAVSLIALARLCEGVGKGGGAIAWNIGHLHFAKSVEAEAYMGVHVFLTGIRGLIMPFVGTFLYLRYGPLAFVVSTALSLAGILTFAALARRQHQAAP